MLNHQFLSEFSQNFIEQVQRILNIDGYLMYCIDNMNHAYNYNAFNIPKNSVDDYLEYGVENDPVSFKNFYTNSSKNIEILSNYNYGEQYSYFINRWEIQDTAEIFFRKRNGEPVFGLSVVREKGYDKFTEFDCNILKSFYFLSERYFHHHTDTVDQSYLSVSYKLTKKEIKVLEQLLSGINNTMIASNLNCSLATIKTHIQHIYQKINVENRQQLLCKFLR